MITSVVYRLEKPFEGDSLYYPIIVTLIASIIVELTLYSKKIFSKRFNGNG